MLITLVPSDFYATSMTGPLLTDGAQDGFFLTLPKGDGLPGSAIPAGTYPVVLRPSAHFQVLAKKDAWFAAYADFMPHIDDIPGRSLIMIHPGNVPSQTDGCILVGSLLNGEFLDSSRVAFARLWQKIQSANGDVQLQMLPYWPSNVEQVRGAAVNEQ